MNDTNFPFDEEIDVNGKEIKFNTFDEFNAYINRTLLDSIE